ncbi:hypothetical protein KGF54_000570 [Candida jiufengensis]|uniref:uncharacterized protein n=1 Tax=Candida jiufengensis TaxID=497108 RepID=UPI002224501C|nr:uncharacterized protein KGF54_000570 [Candida jiufengensis]KAI5956951.1 hypothetical protein KGF54_000570 [Candida jiufengensis]
MLRREPTTIKLSPEDVLEFDEFIEQQKLLKQQQPQQQQNVSQTSQQNTSTTINNNSNLHQNHNNTDLSPSSILLQEQLNNSGEGILPDYKQNESLQDRQIKSKNERIGVNKN